MRKIILALTLLWMITACQNSNHFDKKHRFENNNWFKFNDLKYDIPVNAGETYSFTGNIITDSSYQNRKIEIGFYLILPSGEERLSDQSIRILDYNYLPVGENTEAGISVPVDFKKHLSVSENGILKLQISLHSQNLDNFGIIGIDLFVKKE